MADFNFYLNKSGIRGPKGEKGDKGYSPSISEEVNTLDDYRLRINNEFDSFVTDNLRGSNYFDASDPNGTYLRYNQDTKKAYVGGLDQATGVSIGGARLANDSDMETFSENTIVTPALFADSLVNLIVSPDGSLNITQNEQTSKTEITFNSTTLDTVRAELNRVKEDLATESQVRLNADNQQQVAIDAERRERETQDAALQAQISSISGNFVTVDTQQDITGQKNFDYITSKNLIVSNGSAKLQITGDNSTLSIKPVGLFDDLVIGDANRFNGLTLAALTGVKFEGDIPSIKKGNDYKKILSQDTVEQGDNIIVEQTTNGIKISSTGGGGKSEWGSITGNIEDQTDLKGQLDAIYDTIGDEVEAIDAMLDLKAEKANTYTKEEVNQIETDINAHIEAVEGEIPTIATTDKAGIVQPDGTTITIDSDGKISAVGGSGSGDMTTDTDQNVTGVKTFIGETLKLGSSDGQGATLHYDPKTYPSKDHQSFGSGFISMGAPLFGSYYKLHLQTYQGQLELYTSPVVDLDGIIAGENISLEKNENNGTVTISASGVDPEIETRVENLEEKVDELQLYKFPNATIEGDPTINNGQVSNFSTTNYLRFPFEFKTEGRTWLLNGSFDTDSDVTNQQNIIDSLASIALAVRNGRLVLALSTNGISFNLGEHLSMSDIEPNTKYYYRLSFSGTQYLLSISTDKQEWLPEIVVASDQPIASKPMTISSPGHPFKGTINLNDYDLTVGNLLVWQGMDDVGIASRMDVNASNATDSAKEVMLNTNGLESGKQDTSDTKLFNEVLDRERNSFDLSKFTIVGTPTITNDGMLNSNQSGCVQTINFNPQYSWEINARIIATQSFVDSTDEYIIGNSTWSGTGILRTRNSINAYFVKEDGIDLNTYIILPFSLDDVIDLVWGYDKDNSKYYFYLFKNGQRFDAEDIISSDKIKSGTLQIGRYSSGQLPRYYGTCTYDLKRFDIFDNGTNIFSGKKTGVDIINDIEIPYTQSKTGSKIVDAQYKDRVEDAYTTNGEAIYYVLDKEKSTVQLPKGDIYGMITKINDTIGDVSRLLDLINGVSSVQTLAATPMMLSLETTELDVENSFASNKSKAVFSEDIQITPLKEESYDDDTDIDLGGTI